MTIGHSTPLRISIVTPSLNQGKYIAEALTSVQQQNYPELEHIVVDGGSKDGTLDLLSSYSANQHWEHLRWVSEPDGGQSDALNKGFRTVSGEIIGWLNADDRYRSNCFDRVLRAFASYPEADVIYGDYTWMTEGGRVFRIRREIEFSRFILFYHKISYIPTTAAFFRRRVFEEENFLNESYKFAMDYEFFVRLAKRGYRIVHVPELLADFRWQPESKSSRAPQEQIHEHNRVARTHSKLLSGLSTPAIQSATLSTLRLLAATLRYSEKLRRGFYWKQFHINP